MSTSSSETFDPSRRRLCPDGTCIGLLDESGRCKECGLVAGAARAARPLPETPDEPQPPPEPAAEEPLREAADAQPAEGGEAAFNPGRRLCPDGSCVGVLGADGRCSVCGRGEE
jgi:hypothetical protein